MSILRTAEVQSIRLPQCSVEDEGLSGTVIICESHIAVHTFPCRKYVMLDVASCKDFDDADVSELIRRTFGAKRIDAQVIQRGKGFKNV